MNGMNGMNPFSSPIQLSPQNINISTQNNSNFNPFKSNTINTNNNNTSNNISFNWNQPKIFQIQNNQLPTPANTPIKHLNSIPPLPTNIINHFHFINNNNNTQSPFKYFSNNNIQPGYIYSNMNPVLCSFQNPTNSSQNNIQYIPSQQFLFNQYYPRNINSNNSNNISNSNRNNISI